MNEKRQHEYKPIEHSDNMAALQNDATSGNKMAIAAARRESGDSIAALHSWPHAPEHRLFEPGAYILTAGTYRKEHYLRDAARKDVFLTLLFELAAAHGWHLQAWAVLSNHYHLVALSPPDVASLRNWVSALHRRSARAWNEEDSTPGRQIWHNYWETRITYQRSYMARLKYVHDNPVHHGLVTNAADYRWCSRAWLQQQASRTFVKTLDSFRTDTVKVIDDF